ncbi:MAG: PilZ domain-containing protein [Pseudomonadota bacterium]
MLPDNNANSPASTPDSDNEALQPTHVLISERAEIVQILHQLLQMQINITLQITTSEGIRTTHSTVLRIDEKSKPAQVVLHQPEHATWYRLLEDRPVAKITCHMPNGRLAFSTRLAPLEAPVEKNFYCSFSVPKEIRKYQLRTSYRVSVVPGTSIAKLMIDDNRLGGECLDFSISGCCLVFHPTPGAHLQENSELNNLTLRLDGINDLTVNVKVCRVTTTKTGRLIVGAKYLDLTKQQQTQLQTALTQLQRQQLKTKTRLY